MKDSLMIFVKKRIEENKQFFNQDEYKLILKNKNLIKKIYILGLKDCKQILSKLL